MRIKSSINKGGELIGLALRLDAEEMFEMREDLKKVIVLRTNITKNSSLIVSVLREIFLKHFNKELFPQNTVIRLTIPQSIALFQSPLNSMLSTALKQQIADRLLRRCNTLLP